MTATFRSIKAIAVAAACLLVGGVWVAGPVLASERRVPDHAPDRAQDRARAAVLSGEVLPLSTVLERLQRTHPGQVLEVELERDDGRWVYEVKLLHANGQLLKIELDARTGAVMEVRQRGRSKDRSRHGTP